MSEWKLLSDKGMKKTYMRLDEHGRMEFKEVENIDAFLKQTEMYRNELGKGISRNQNGNIVGMRPYAAIPPSVVRMWQLEGFDILDPNMLPEEKTKMLRKKISELPHLRLTEGN